VSRRRGKPRLYTIFSRGRTHFRALDASDALDEMLAAVVQLFAARAVHNLAKLLYFNIIAVGCERALVGWLLKHKLLKTTCLGGLMRKIVGVISLVLGMATIALASNGSRTPEIDGATGLAAVTLVTSAILIVRGRRKS